MEKDDLHLLIRMLKCPFCSRHLKEDFFRWDELILAMMQDDSAHLTWEARNIGSCPTCGRDVKNQYLIYVKMIRDKLSLPVFSPKQKATILTFLEMKTTSQNPTTSVRGSSTDNTLQTEKRSEEIKHLYDDLFSYLEQLAITDPHDLAHSTDLAEYDEILTRLSHLDSENYLGFRLKGTNGIEVYEVEILVRGILSYLSSKHGYEFQG